MIKRNGLSVLIGCERSGIVREAFAARGFEAYSCDLLPQYADSFNGAHYECDLFDLVDHPDHHWDLIIAHPPCTFLSSSGLHWNKRTPSRAEKTEAALDFVRRIMAIDVPHLAVENPVGCIGTRIRKADQYIQPYQFGHDASKKTGLWLRGLPRLRPTRFIEPRIVDGRPRWSNQTDSGQNRLSPSENRATERSETYQGIADAMADQWGAFLIGTLAA